MTKNVVGRGGDGRGEGEERTADGVGVCGNKGKGRGVDTKLAAFAEVQPDHQGSVVTVLRYIWSSLLLIASCFIARPRETGLEEFWNDDTSFHLRYMQNPTISCFTHLPSSLPSSHPPVIIDDTSSQVASHKAFPTLQRLFRRAFLKIDHGR